MSKDRFSHAPGAYQQFRPRYARSLFQELAQLTEQHELAWDCGCGSGQASLGLAEEFAQVVATDLSPAQIAQAPARANVIYAAARAEQVPLAPASVDLVLVAQALHWFRFTDFFQEVDRILKPSGVLVALTYNLLSVSAEVDALVETLYYKRLSGCWDEERRHVENGYADIPLPYRPLPDPVGAHSLQAQWNVDHMLGYLRTWSGVKQYRRRHGNDPVALIEPALREAWGAGERRVDWPLTMLVRRKPG